MTARVEIRLMAYDLDQVLREAPVQRLRSNNGEDVFEQQVLVGDVKAPEDAREQLELYGIVMELAHFDRRAGRWTRCLFSEPCANTLVELAGEGQFPFSFDAAPSSGHIRTLEAVAGGLTPPALALREWVKPATVEELARAVKSGWIQSCWLRQAVVVNSKWR